MSKSTLVVISIVLVLMGAAALVPAWDMASEPLWHAVAKIVIGLVGLFVALADKKK